MEYITYQQDAKIGYVTLDNDKQRNALSAPLIEELNTLLAQIGEKSDVHVVIIQAAGKVFSSGHNLREIEGQTSQENLALFKKCEQLMKTMRDIPQVIISKVHGIATAAGCQLVAASDLAVASEKASFGAPGVHIGLFCSTPAVFISRNVGRKKAAEMLFSGDLIPAEDALAHGLVNKVVAHEQLDQVTLDLAKSVSRHSLSTLAIGKKEFYQQLNMEDFQALNYASEVIALNSEHEDAKEGIRAFIEKRQPSWREE
ncbi:enoyl-CoA hydratase-related protein [Aquibacillus rhizosphaerae]|uniref:Enoyl-CoA hydratase domain-containing protein 3, mitochondrial n=1 Tax=Aquibacillus rhizosphaerae TaxID=3051431 RepID=A0ABT7L078_9BACI|nr:enoyl-CoA hydratase-related protein [Aquibacillus sp. LR5S19]MDL4839175.1 enoyl-CoA hydratase-related protein [Aquibacillus sp. LR5S19]